MSLLLAVDTSGALVTVAAADGDSLLAEQAVELAARHAEHLAPMIAAVLVEAGRAIDEVSAVAVGVGPGPFTGLRVGVVTARVLGLVLGVPVIGVCSLDALALQVAEWGEGSAGSAAGAGDLAAGRQFVVTSDARRREVYWAAYRTGDGEPEPVRGPGVDRPADLASAAARDGLGQKGFGPFFGRGAALYPEVLTAPPEGAPLDVRAGAVARLAGRRVARVGGSERARGQEPVPLYLRRPDAVAPGARKRVS